MNEKWTAGPWARCDAEINEGASAHGWFVRVAPNRIISVEGRTSDEANANAHLIAAAPDLYEAARCLLEWAASVEGQEVSRGITKTKGSVFEYAREALAKARGEST